MLKYEKFQLELIELINKHGLESKSDTPDFLLAEYLVTCLKNYDNVVKQKTNWVIKQKSKSFDDFIKGK